jgi:hypothetical protein
MVEVGLIGFALFERYWRLPLSGVQPAQEAGFWLTLFWRFGRSAFYADL